jgi:hypothetical protein
MLVIPTWLLGRAADTYRRRPDGSLQFNGTRPGPGWHAHGYCLKHLLFWERMRLVLRRVYKRRWLHVESGRTCHSRPPDDPPYVRVSTPLILLMLSMYMALAVGCDASAVVDECRSPQTFQRWCTRARRVATPLQQAIRHTLIEFCEPRPVESLFEGGLSPPWVAQPSRHPEPSPDVTLCGGLWMALIGAVRLVIPLSSLLAEARRRWTGPRSTFPL